jgi:hypothetical protein
MIESTHSIDRGGRISHTCHSVYLLISSTLNNKEKKHYENSSGGIDGREEEGWRVRRNVARIRGWRAKKKAVGEVLAMLGLTRSRKGLARSRRRQHHNAV